MMTPEEPSGLPVAAEALQEPQPLVLDDPPVTCTTARAP